MLNSIRSEVYIQFWENLLCFEKNCVLIIFCILQLGWNHSQVIEVLLSRCLLKGIIGSMSKKKIMYCSTSTVKPTICVKTANTVETLYNEVIGTGVFCSLYQVICYTVDSRYNKLLGPSEIILNFGTKKITLLNLGFVISVFFITRVHCIRNLYVEFPLYWYVTSIVSSVSNLPKNSSNLRLLDFNKF